MSARTLFDIVLFAVGVNILYESVTAAMEVGWQPRVVAMLVIASVVILISGRILLRFVTKGS